MFCFDKKLFPGEVENNFLEAIPPNPASSLHLFHSKLSFHVIHSMKDAKSCFCFIMSQESKLVQVSDSDDFQTRFLTCLLVLDLPFITPVASPSHGRFFPLDSTPPPLSPSPHPPTHWIYRMASYFLFKSTVPPWNS